MTKSPERYNQQETEARTRAILHGAFSGPPTPLKDIPKKNGESRAVGPNQPRKRRRQRKKRVA